VYEVADPEVEAASCVPGVAGALIIGLVLLVAGAPLWIIGGTSLALVVVVVMVRAIDLDQESQRFERTGLTPGEQLIEYD
jgi:hypothetical protein